MMPFDSGRVPPITYGAGRLDDVPSIVAGLGAGPVLVVADRVLADLGVTARLEKALDAAGFGVETAAEITGEPKDPLIDSFVRRAQATGCKTVIGLGGGAAMDAGKLVAAIACSDKPALHYALAANPFPAAGLPSIAIPTTAGTGSEVTRTSIVSTEEGLKYWYWGEELMFSHAVLDPEPTLSLPPQITAWTGIDAVAHALEAVTNRRSSPVGRLNGLAALEILTTSLPEAVRDGGNVARRAEVLWAATVAGLALHNCNTHMGHNISHALGSLAPVHHGLATGLALEVTLPELVSRPGGEENYAAAALALGGASDPADLPLRFADLMRRCGIEAALPAACQGVDTAALAHHMKSPANRMMADNAPCEPPLSDADLDAFAGEILSLPKLEQAA